MQIEVVVIENLICVSLKRMKMKVMDFQENEHCLKLNPASANWESFLKLATEKPNLVKSW